MAQIVCLRCTANQRIDNRRPRNPGVNQDRDMVAMARLLDLIRRPSDTVTYAFNVHSNDIMENSARDRIKKGDVVLTTTRLPLDDDKPAPRKFARRQQKPPIKRVPSGNNWLE